MTSDAAERLAQVPLQQRMQAAHKLVATTDDADERKGMLAVMLWPRWTPPALTQQRREQLAVDVWSQGVESLPSQPGHSTGLAG